MISLSDNVINGTHHIPDAWGPAENFVMGKPKKSLHKEKRAPSHGEKKHKEKRPRIQRKHFS